MTWKNGRRLATFTNGDVSASFDYDADGLRTTKTVGTSRVDYYRAGGLLLGEVHTDGDESYTINYMYDESGRMLGFRLDGAEYYYVRDYSGDVTGLINSRGELIGSYLYDPWGVLLETYLNTFEEETAGWTDADRTEYMRVLNLNPIRYKSYYYDTETGFYYLQSRYYDPITTRFISPDTVDVLTVSAASITDRNLYAYCDNNPIVRYDDGGEFWHIIVGAAVGALSNVAGQLISDICTSVLTQEASFSSWQTYVGSFVGGAVGGAIVGATGNCQLANVANGFISTGVGMSLEKMTGDSDVSWKHIAVSASVDSLISLGMGDTVKINKVTAGRNSMSAVYKSGLTKLRNGTASTISKKVIAKGLFSEVVGGLGCNAADAIKRKLQHISTKQFLVSERYEKLGY